jgi:hypothetical protein
MRTNQRPDENGTDTTCPSRGEAVDKNELFDEKQCPKCGTSTSELFELAVDGVAEGFEGP